MTHVLACCPRVSRLLALFVGMFAVVEHLVSLVEVTFWYSRSHCPKNCISEILKILVRDWFFILTNTHKLFDKLTLTESGYSP